MTRTEHLLDILGEECAEVIKRCSKAMRFGLYERQAENQIVNEKYSDVLSKESYFDNASRIALEFNQAIAIAEMLEDEQLIPDFNIEQVKINKKARVEEFLEYSKKIGTLS